MDHAGQSLFISFFPLFLLSACMAASAHFLAKDKGRNVALWTILALIPVINFGCIWYFIGASNLRMERKLDDLMSTLQRLDAQAADKALAQA